MMLKGARGSIGDERRMVTRFGVLSVAVVLALFVGAAQASAATLTVCQSGCAFKQLAPALAAAKSGDKVKVGPGTYAGGVTVDISIRLVGAGPGETIIRGGGPVLTIGTFGASTEPTVSIHGVTIRGGVTRSSPESVPFTGQHGAVAEGGGVAIPSNADFDGGATVTISNSVITGNRVAPRRTVQSDGQPFAFAGGGGIDSWGRLTLRRTVVSNNRVGAASGLSTVATDNLGAGIMNWARRLTIRRSVIRGNHTSAIGAHRRVAEGGAIFTFGPTMVIGHSVVTGNSARLAAASVSNSDAHANAGAIHTAGRGTSTTIRHTIISGNSVTMTNSVGDANAFSGVVNVEEGNDFELRHSVIANNSVTSRTLPGSSGDALGDSGAGEISGTITHTRITGNTVTVRSATRGDALAGAGAALLFGATMRHSVVSHNHVYASSRHGSVFADGGGLVVDAPGLTLRDATVRKNRVTAKGASGRVRGGGIFDAPVPDGAPGGPLVLVDSRVTRNVLSGSSGNTLKGGGLFIRNQPLTLTHSAIANNSPDDCFGC